MSFPLLYILSPAFVVLVLGIVYLTLGATKNPLLPPGPPPDPLIGHVRLIPRHHQAEFYHELAKKYGTYRLDPNIPLAKHRLSDF